MSHMTNQATSLTIADITEQARRENLSNNQIRTLLFYYGFDHKVEFPVILAALGREVGGDAKHPTSRGRRKRQ